MSSYNFEYTGAVQTVTLNPGNYIFEVWGAQGGYRSTSANGGAGGYSYGKIYLASKTTLYVYVGGAGNTGKTSGGFNGGGGRSTYNGGGGASDIRIGSDSLYARVIVAGGGGSDGAATKVGGAGGGLSGVACGSGCGTNNGAGTQTSGASFGSGGYGVYSNNGYGGAGGGGWYGGYGTTPDSSADDDKGGSGGSGYVYTSDTASNYPSGCLLNSDYYLTDATLSAGNTSFSSPSGTSETGHTGNGYARITEVFNEDTQTKLIYTVLGEEDEIILNQGSEITPPGIPEKDGYVFAGWYSDSSYTTTYEFGDVATSDFIYIYAKMLKLQKCRLYIFDGTKFKEIKPKISKFS